MTGHNCLLCIDGMMPAGIDPIFGPVYRTCPCCHIPCLDCAGAATFPATGGWALELLGTALYALGYKTDICRSCFGTTNLWSDDHHTDEDQADTIHRVEDVLRVLTDTYWTKCQRYQAAPQPDSPERIYLRGQLAMLADLGNQIADALRIAPPDWEFMREHVTPDPWAEYREPGANP